MEDRDKVKESVGEEGEGEEVLPPGERHHQAHRKVGEGEVPEENGG